MDTASWHSCHSMMGFSYDLFLLLHPLIEARDSAEDHHIGLHDLSPPLVVKSFVCPCYDIALCCRPKPPCVRIPLGFESNSAPNTKTIDLNPGLFTGVCRIRGEVVT